MSLTRLLDFLFGCHHSNFSRVFTIGRRTYRVCCGCGAQFDYSLESMSITSHSTGEKKTTIPQDCDTCHEALAIEESNPQILKTLGLADRIATLQKVSAAPELSH